MQAETTTYFVVWWVLLESSNLTTSLMVSCSLPTFFLAGLYDLSLYEYGTVFVLKYRKVEKEINFTREKMKALKVTEKRRGVTGPSVGTLTISQIQLSCEDFAKAVSNWFEYLLCKGITGVASRSRRQPKPNYER